MKNTIQPNTTITVHFIGDSQLRPTLKVIDRKGNFVTVIIDAIAQRRKIYNSLDREYILPYGKYSMAPAAY